MGFRQGWQNQFKIVAKAAPRSEKPRLELSPALPLQVRESQEESHLVRSAKAASQHRACHSELHDMAVRTPAAPTHTTKPDSGTTRPGNSRAGGGGSRTGCGSSHSRAGQHNTKSSPTHTRFGNFHRQSTRERPDLARGLPGREWRAGLGNS